MNAKKRYIEIIDVLHLIAALIVTVYHSGAVGEHGFFAVDIMFVMSGYLMMRTSSEERTALSIFGHKAKRIIPLYWTATITMYLIIKFMPQLSVMSEAKPEYLIKSLLFIPFTNSKGYSAPIIGLGWMLNYEMFFALIFAIAFAISKEKKGIIASVLITGLVLIGTFFNLPFELAWYFDSIMMEFVLGIVAYYILEEVKDMVIKEKIAPISMLACAAVAILMENYTDVMPRWLVLGIPMAVCFFIGTAAFPYKTFDKWIIECSKCSYEIHIVGYFVTAAYKLLTTGAGIFVRVIGLIATVVVTVVLSYLTRQLFKKFNLA